MDDQKYWLGFSLIPNMGAVRINQLIQHFGNPEQAWRADARELAQAGLSVRSAEELTAHRAKIDLDAELQKLQRLNAHMLVINDPEYPPSLKQIASAPVVLFVRGKLSAADERALAIVGTRRATRYGRDVSRDFARQLAMQGITIISGLAEGIDTAAHEGALDGGGRTIAVLGSGIDIIYPRSNQKLAQRIAENGAVITEHPPGTPPIGPNFPRRNRIISGLSLGVLVAEAPEKSGAIITCSTALEQGKDVFAIPANIFNPVGQGCNRLIQDGAKLVIEARDILDELNIMHAAAETRTRTEQAVPANDVESRLMSLLNAEPTHIDDLVRLSQMSVEVVSATLAIMELKGLAQSEGRMQYCRARS